LPPGANGARPNPPPGRLGKAASPDWRRLLPFGKKRPGAKGPNKIPGGTGSQEPVRETGEALFQCCASRVASTLPIWGGGALTPLLKAASECAKPNDARPVKMEDIDTSAYTKTVQRAVSAAVLSTVRPQQLGVRVSSGVEWCPSLHAPNSKHEEPAQKKKTSGLRSSKNLPPVASRRLPPPGSPGQDMR